MRLVIFILSIFLTSCISPTTESTEHYLRVSCAEEYRKHISAARDEWMKSYSSLIINITYTDINPNFVCDDSVEFPIYDYATLKDGVIRIYPQASGNDPEYITFSSMHEIGHMIWDIDHAPDPSAVMGVFFDWGNEELCITQSDIDWICEEAGDCTGRATCKECENL